MTYTIRQIKFVVAELLPPQEIVVVVVVVKYLLVWRSLKRSMRSLVGNVEKQWIAFIVITDNLNKHIIIIHYSESCLADMIFDSLVKNNMMTL